MAVVEILLAWFALSLTGALMPGPLSAACVMQANRHGRLHGILPMLGHAIVELGIVAVIIVSVQVFMFDNFTTGLLVGIGASVIVIFGLLALKDYRYKEKDLQIESHETSAKSVAEATMQGATVSIFSPYFLLWWAAIGLSNVTLLVNELQVGVGMVFIAGVLIYLTHVSTDFLFGAVLAIGTDKTSKRAKVRGINWINVIIGIFQIFLGIWFIIQAFPLIMTV